MPHRTSEDQIKKRWHVEKAKYYRSDKVTQKDFIEYPVSRYALQIKSNWLIFLHVVVYFIWVLIPLSVIIVES